MVTRSDVQSLCTEESIRTVRLLYVGNDGVIRGHVVDGSRLESAFRDGLAVPKSVQSITALDEQLSDGGFGSVGEVRLVPDAESFRVLPYADACAAVFCNLYEDGREPWNIDPRSTLESYLESLTASGFEPSVAFESEFHLVEETEEGMRPADEGGVYAADAMQATHPFVREVTAALEQQGIDFVRYYSEHAPGKHEIVTEHERGIPAVDEYLLTTETIRHIARRHDRRATFLPVPFDGATNGCHVHLSLWHGDENRFHDPTADSRYSLSDEARHFVGGLLEHAHALTALTAPTVNSYSRLRPGQEASAYVCWGLDHREAMIRIPSPTPSDGAGTTRIEFRPADNTANPYLCLLGILAAGMDGIERELDPGPPLRRDPADRIQDADSKAVVERLPQSLDDALQALVDDDELSTALGPELLETYVAVKRALWESFTDSAEQWKRETFRRIY